MQHVPTGNGRRSGAAFTLVEILIVVVILGILAAIVVPQFTSAARESRENSIKMSLHRVREMLEIYREHHLGKYPALATFEDQMTQASTPLGATAAPGTAGFDLGPYIREIPTNPNSAGTAIGDGAVGSSDWYYNEATGEFRANDSDATREY